MTANGQHHPQEAHGEPGGATVQLLERLDNWAHIVVAAFFILMATTVIVHMGFIFLRQLPLIMPAAPAAETKSAAMPPAAAGEKTAAKSAQTESGHEETKAAPNTAETAYPAMAGTAPEGVTVTARDAAGKMLTATTTPARTETKMEAKTEEARSESAPDPFVKNSLELLSNILFVVILLELLRTIITYLQTHDIQAIMQEFLVVGIISSVRKILLVGAEASLRQGASQTEFIQEAGGVVIDIIGILLLILGLVMLKRAFGSKAQKELQEA